MKKKILIGLACLALLCVVLPYAASAQDPETTFGLDVIRGEGELDDTFGDTDDPRIVASRVINVALGFLGIVAVVLVLYGGFMWMTAAGNEERVTKAKQILTAALIGLVIIIMAWGLTQFVLEQLMGAATGVAPL